MATAPTIVRADPVELAFKRHVSTNIAQPIESSPCPYDQQRSQTFERRVNDPPASRPVRLVRRFRVEHADYRLRTIDANIGQVAAKVGHANASTLRAWSAE